MEVPWRRLCIKLLYKCNITLIAVRIWLCIGTLWLPNHSSADTHYTYTLNSSKVTVNIKKRKHLQIQNFEQYITVINQDLLYIPSTIYNLKWGTHFIQQKYMDLLPRSSIFVYIFPGMHVSTKSLFCQVLGEWPQTETKHFHIWMLLFKPYYFFTLLNFSSS